jgi:hypothetical protein
MSTNINPNSAHTSENKAGSYILGPDVSLGKSALTPGADPSTLDNAIDTSVLKIDIDLGVAKEAPRSNAAIKDTVKSPPSGYSALGVPTYGDGAINRVTVWPADDEQTGKGELSHYAPQAIVHKDYDSLAN